MSANDVMEHFAFPGNIDFAADDQGEVSCLFMRGCCVDSWSVKQCLPSVNHEQFSIQLRRTAATKYYNYTVNETDDEREHRLPTIPKATRLDQATLKVYYQNYLLRCSDRQPRGGDSSYERGGDVRRKF